MALTELERAVLNGLQSRSNSEETAKLDAEMAEFEEYIVSQKTFLNELEVKLDNIETKLDNIIKMIEPKEVN